MHSEFLPITRKEMLDMAWEQADIILVSGDAYVDHPSFGTAVIGRILEKNGYKVAIIPQPNWRDDLRDFKKFGKPRLFFGITAGSMDSMVNHYTANKRLRSDDAYTPDGVAGFRPDYPTVVYSRILKELYPDAPIVIGGIEASLRRLAHYDYWEDRIRPSILIDSQADLLVYGMGEKPVVEIAARLDAGKTIRECCDIPQTAYISQKNELLPEDVVLSSYEDCLQSKRAQARNFRHIEEESNKIHAARILQQTRTEYVVVNPPYVYEEFEIDQAFDLPFTRLPHPKYKKRGEIPAYTMIRHSINIHRGCFGGCSFCTISAHQGKQIQSRSESSVLKEIESVVQMSDFKGNISDLGGPSANMYRMSGIDKNLCGKCKKNSCLFPSVCPNLNRDHRPFLELYEKVRKHPSVKHCYIGSGIRYDLFIDELDKERGSNSAHGKAYLDTILKYGVSGRLKVAPEHTEADVLKLMRKMPFEQFEVLKRYFENFCIKNGQKMQLIPYFISSFPGCKLKDMEALEQKTRRLGYRLEQVQNFTPTPMTLAAEMYYTGLNPYTLEAVYVPKSEKERKAQNEYFFTYKKKGEPISKHSSSEKGNFHKKRKRF